jgi:hypothetical protein
VRRQEDENEGEEGGGEAKRRRRAFEEAMQMKGRAAHGTIFHGWCRVPILAAAPALSLT